VPIAGDKCGSRIASINSLIYDDGSLSHTANLLGVAHAPCSVLCGGASGDPRISAGIQREHWH